MNKRVVSLKRPNSLPPSERKPHKHKFHPVNDTVLDLSRRVKKVILVDENGNNVVMESLGTYRVWVCECGITKLVREK
ncbi:MAG: hypothetical protein WC307_06255 [Candidatus Nanoarchaeia archaeon]|jgi:hypothetical protein